MSKVIIPASPNWYCTKVVDSNKFGYLVFGARHDVVIFDCQSFPVTYKGVFVSHKEKVTAVSVNNHEVYSTLCCSGGEDGGIKLWCMENKEDKETHSLHTNKVTSICWSPIQPDLIVSGDEAGNVAVWQFEDDRQAMSKPDKGSVTCIAASPKNPAVMAIGYKTGQIYLVDVKKGAVIFLRLRGHDEEIHSIAWCPVPGEEFRPTVASTSDITDLESFGVESSWRKKPKPKTSDGDFGTEGWLLASGCRDRTIRVWSTSKGRQLLLLKLPHVGRKDRTDDSGRTKLWLTLCWPPWSPCKLVSGCQSGEILQWDITKEGKERCQSYQSLSKGHSRFVFNIIPVEAVKDVKMLCATSMDRTISFWNTDLRCQVGSLPSLGGYVYAINVSPSDPGRVALGIGDAMIRIWNLNALPESNEMTSLWQGIRSKVTALCWHPEKEGLLAYGTDDGRVGIYDTLSNKPPSISTTYHKRTVYVVSWGPPSILKADGKKNYNLYSCGDGNILEHRRDKLNDEATQINKLIQTTNPGYRNQTRVPTRSEISWFHDFSVLVVGNDDGTVEVYEPPTFRLLATIQVQHKLINSLRWHPHITMASPSGSPYRHWLAIASNESVICVVDLSNVLEERRSKLRLINEDEEEEDKEKDPISKERDDVLEPLQITESFKKLDGHSQRITSTAWSPHIDGQLISVSYDGLAIVWNVVDGMMLACYQGHIGRLLSVEWNGLDPGEVMTGGDDFSLHKWRISAHTVTDGKIEPRKKKKKQKAKQEFRTPQLDEASSSSLGGMNGEPDSNQSTEREDSELEKQKKALLEKMEEILVKDGMNDDAWLDGSASEKSTVQTFPSAKGDNLGKPAAIKAADSATAKKKRKQKSMFPMTGKEENRGKQFVLDDIVTLAKLIFEEESTADSLKREDYPHLGLFLDRRSTYTCLQLEGRKPIQQKLLPTAIPSQFQWTRPVTPSQASRKLRTQDRENRKRKYDDLIFQQINTELSEPFDCSEVVIETDVSVETEEIYTATPLKQYRDCQIQTDSDPKPLFGIENFIDDKKFIHFYTGLECYLNFTFVLKTLGPAAYCLNYMYHQVENVSIENQFFITLMKLRRNLTHFDLSRMFAVSENSVKNVVFTWIIFMSKQWHEYNIWPSRNLVRYFLPSDFKFKFPTTRVIIDGTECQIKKSKAPKAQQATFSTYKHKNTVKTLIGATPGGLISYVSPGFAGSTSDRQIVERSQLFNMCDPGDSIMADKGFNVQDLFATMNVKINVPQFFKKKNRMSGKIVMEDRKIASKRVHIERIIGLGKTYKILCQPLSGTETKISSDIIFVCFMLCNFRTGIISKHA